MKPETKALLRPLNRIRWVSKSRAVRTGLRGSTHRSELRLPGLARYVLWDPEVSTFSYDVRNRQELAAAVAGLMDCTDAVVGGLFDELLEDRELADEIRLATRWHPESKRLPPLGRHLLAYACLRLRRPRLAVEVGAKHGLGSLVLLRALEKNGAEGSQGILLSVDIDPTAGWMVSKRRVGWEFSVGASADVLSSAVAGRPVGFLLSDSVPDPAVTRHEFDVALAHMEAPLVLMQNGSWNSCTRDIATEFGGRLSTVVERPAAHWYPGRQVDMALLGEVPTSGRT